MVTIWLKPARLSGYLRFGSLKVDLEEKHYEAKKFDLRLSKGKVISFFMLTPRIWMPTRTCDAEWIVRSKRFTPEIQYLTEDEARRICGN